MGRRRFAGRLVIRITISSLTGSTLVMHAVADAVVSSFGDGTIHDTLPSGFPVSHVQRSAPAPNVEQWTCWFNSDSPDNAYGAGDIESVSHVLSHFQTKYLCEGGVQPDGIHCQTSASLDWISAGQNLSVICSFERGLVCRNQDNLPNGPTILQFSNQCFQHVHNLLHLPSKKCVPQLAIGRGASATQYVSSSMVP